MRRAERFVNAPSSSACKDVRARSSNSCVALRVATDKTRTPTRPESAFEPPIEPEVRGRSMAPRLMLINVLRS